MTAKGEEEKTDGKTQAKATDGPKDEKTPNEPSDGTEEQPTNLLPKQQGSAEVEEKTEAKQTPEPKSSKAPSITTTPDSKPGNDPKIAGEHS